jgi:hypothetical protein
MRLHFMSRVFLLLAFCAAPNILSQRRLPISREEAVEIESILKAGQRTVSTRTGERVLQEWQLRVTRRNNRRPVGAGILVKARTPSSGPSATFGRAGPHYAEYRTNEKGEVAIRDLVANTIVGSYELLFEIDFVDSDGVRYVGAATVIMQNLKGGWPGWVKYLAIAGGGAGGVCFAGGWCRPGGGGPDATITFGTGRVGPR